MGGREHIRIETVQDAFCCFLSQNLFSFRLRKKPLKKCVKCLQCLEVLVGTLGEFKGTGRWLHSNRPDSGPRVPLIPARDFPLYVCKEPAAGKTYRKYFERRPNRTAQKGSGRGGAIP
jgi:hypothetical protein